MTNELPYFLCGPCTLPYLDDTLALSLRCDGSVDRTQIDNIFVMAKAVTKAGKTKQNFLSAAEPQQRGAKGMCTAVHEAISSVVGETCAKKCLLTCLQL